MWAASAAAGAGPSLLLSPVDLEDRAEWKLEVHEGGGGGGRRPPLYIRQHAHALYVNPDAVIGATWVGGAHSWAAAVVAQDHVEGAFVTVHLLHPRHRYLVRTHYSPPIAMAGDDYRFGNTRLAVARFLGSAGSLLLAGEPTTGRSPLRAVSAKVLDVVAGKTVCSTGGAPVVAAGAAPDAAGRLGAAALLGFRNGTIDLWDARARSTTRVAALPLSPAALEPLSRGRWAVGDVAGDGFITDERAWGRRLAALGGYANSPARATFAAAPAGDAVALACRDNVVRVWGAEGGEPLAKRRVPAVTAVAWWRDERGRDELRLARPWIRSGPPPARELHPGPGGDDND